MLYDYEEREYYAQQSMVTIPKVTAGGFDTTGFAGVDDDAVGDDDDLDMSDGMASDDGHGENEDNTSNRNELKPEDHSDDGGSDEDEEGFAPRLPTLRKLERGRWLKAQYEANVDTAVIAMTQLIEIFKACERKGLSEKDLTLKRSKLSEEDLNDIMASKKVKTACCNSP